MAEQSKRRSRLATLPARIAGRYEPLAKIASGGMATVYLARATTGAGFGKLVALKCVHPHMAEQPDFVEMFLDEARIASRIDHPNVSTVFDAGTDDGTHYIAMEYLHGEPLSELIRRWDRDPDARPERFAEIAARIVADAAMGLHAAHELRGPDGASVGLVHRDVSPQNLFVTYSGSTKVVDFGIAKAAGRLHETTTGVVKGKLAYMSPEQLHNERLDRRTDVWALGVTLWETLTCRRLFKRDDQIATLNAVLDAKVPPPHSLDPKVPAAISDVVVQALAKRREDRFETARALADALNAAIASSGVHVGMSEVADAMSALFAEERAQKEKWVATAQSSPQLVDGARDGDSGAAEPAALDAAAAEPGAVEPTVSEIRPTQLSPTEPVELPVRHTGLWVVAAVGAVALLGAVGLAASMSGPEPASGDPPAAGEPRATDEASEPATEPSPGGSATDPTGEGIPVGLDAPPIDPPAAPDPEPTSLPRAARASSRPSRPEPPTAPPRPPAQAGNEASSVQQSPEPPATPRPVRIVHPGGGWASLRIDGRVDQNTPTTVPALAPGRHVIELRAFGQGPWTRHPVDVPAGSGPHVVRIALQAPSP